ncbi:hypothetical protein [Nocardia huaxiensis]|uniref:DUF8020 domain-containing protein n=1 Tax=Nocardia huaxiensis TaxID=2755382 RepID=A0A7D6ZXR8_9NOCA|nr:hypothetical protein [Nocardia huaxiensis]QLY31209.1 hypothetical protein H0264_02135 [Nocardia huaxiensis]UFS94740.1 hypothetical protein LPY97_28970 [Nocardia huaxiensis]
MLMRKFAATSALVIAAMGITAGTVNAAPAAEPAANDAINYSATTTETNTVIRTDAGSMVVEDGVFKIKAANGTTVAGTELKFRVDDFEFPIAADIAGNTATLTPEFNVEHAVYKPVALPYEDQAPWKNDYEREQAAFNRLKDTIGMGATIGTLVGGIGGAALGCVLGGIAGATIASATIVGLFGPFVPAAVVGCIAGMGAVGFLGTLAGQLFITAPVAILAAVQYFTTVNSGMTPGKK